MAGGLHIFGSGSSMMVLKVEPDKTFDLMQISERFEVPYEEPKTPQEVQQYAARIQTAAKLYAKEAINTYTRLRKWKFYDKRPVELDTSNAQYDLDEFRTSRNVLLPAVDQGSLTTKKGMVAYVIKIWFVVPKIIVETVKPEIDDPDTTDGFVNPYNITDFVPLEPKKELLNRD